jgi:MFS superfamily sulfate permease-like transporter
MKQSWFFANINKIDKHLAKKCKERGRRHKLIKLDMTRDNK